MTDSTFLKKLRYWTPFVCINAAPSYLICWDVAKQLLLRQHTGMIAGILLCVLGYAWATSRPLYHRWVESSSLGKGLPGRTLPQNGHGPRQCNGGAPDRPFSSH